MSRSDTTLGVFGYVCTPDEALAAAKRIRDSEYTRFDVLTPFPVHGMDEAMGLKRSWVPWMTAGLAATGILAAQVMMVGIMVLLWPMNFGGKPFMAWPSFIPITFELMVLFAGIGTAVIAIFAGKRWTVPQPPVLNVRTGATVDRFVLWISSEDPAFDREKTAEFLRELRVRDVRPIDEEDRDVE